jgi:hypothetical protein
MALGLMIVVLGVVLLLRSLGILEDVSGETVGALAVIGVGAWIIYARLTWRRRWRNRIERIRIRRERRDRFVA